MLCAMAGDHTVTVQLALYPLGVDDLAPVLTDALEPVRKSGVRLEIGRMSSFIEGTQEDVFAALQAAFAAAASRGRTVLVVTVSNACSGPPLL